MHEGMDRYQRYLQSVLDGSVDYNADKFREVSGKSLVEQPCAREEELT